MTRTAALASGLLAAAVFVAAASPASLALRLIDRARASGDSAIALASGTAKRPKGIVVKVTAVPNQGISGNWTMVCSKGFGAGSKSGRFAGTTPLTRTLRMPMTNPNDCTVSGIAQLKRSGRIVVSLYRKT